MPYIDTHTHLYHSRFDADRDAMMHRALEAGVECMLLPNIDEESLESMHELHASYPENTRMMMGLHPCSVKEDFEKVLERLEALFDQEHYVAVGEFGVDLYWDKSFFVQQQEAFRVQMGWAKNRRLPVVLHVRDAFQETFALMDETHDSEVPGVFHCFTGGTAEVDRIAAYGNYYFGIGGVVTFKNGGLDQVLDRIPEDRLLLETDSPFLAPVPYRGKRNESVYLIEVAERVAELKGWTTDEVARVTTANAQRLFGLL